MPLARYLDAGLSIGLVGAFSEKIRDEAWLWIALGVFATFFVVGRKPTISTSSFGLIQRSDGTAMRFSILAERCR